MAHIVTDSTNEIPIEISRGPVKLMQYVIYATARIAEDFRYIGLGG